MIAVEVHRRRAIRGALAAMVAVSLTGCVVERPRSVAESAPRYPDYPMPTVPAALAGNADVVARHQAAWRQLQAGDLRRARAEFSEVFKRAPTFYPGETGLGFVELASRRYEQATARFSAVIARAANYLPAWIGQSEALLALGRDEEAIAAIEKVLELDPRREVLKARLELVQFRLVQSLIEAGRQARRAGHVDQARQVFERALARSPASPVILHELSLTEREAGQLARAETYARRGVAIDPRDGEAQAAHAVVLADLGRFADAAAAYDRALALEPREEWRERAAEVRARARTAALPAELSDITTASSVTRGQMAAYLGIRLEGLVARAPARVVDVATDVRRHWAANWILPITRAGIMTLYPNHTFQPGAAATRVDLASAANELLRVASAGRAAEFAKWQAARPRFPDLTASNVGYRAAAIAVSAGVMAANARGEFGPTRPASGADLEAAVRRLSDLTSR